MTAHFFSSVVYRILLLPSGGGLGESVKGARGSYCYCSPLSPSTVDYIPVSAAVLLFGAVQQQQWSAVAQIRNPTDSDIGAVRANLEKQT